MDWHAKSEEEVLSDLKTEHSGLSPEEREKRLSRYGPNEFKKEKKFELLGLLWSQLKSPLSFILVIAGFLAFLLAEYANAFVIFLAVLINTLVGMIQEGRASRAFEKIQSSIKKTATVFIEGQERRVDSTRLVPGDIIALRMGDQVPADGRVLESKGLEINEASLTGEWLPVPKEPGTLPEKTTIFKRSNMVYMGSLVSDGWALAAVTQTGGRTQIGKLAKELEDDFARTTPFQTGVKKISHFIGMLVFAVTLVIFVAGITRGESLGEVIFVSIAVAVATVPEGLPVAVTVILAVGMERMLRQGALIRRLAATETLGSTSVLLTDKTGTLTKGTMQTSSILSAEEILSDKEGREEEELTDIFREGRLNSLLSGMHTADVTTENLGKELKELKISGRPTDVALFRAAVEAGINPAEALLKHPRVDFLPFDSERRFSVSLNAMEKQKRLFVSGAPETILRLANRYENGKETIYLDEKAREELKRAESILSRDGARVLAAAYKDSDLRELPHQDLRKFGRDKTDEFFSNLIFVGFVSFRDPLREDAKGTLETANQANVKIVMLTGDHKNTAEKIASEVGIVPPKIMEGEELEDITPEGLKKRVSEINVFARVLPHQKSSIVKAWQQKDEIVAMTGDGVNDAPALKQADIGVALGSGTDVAKEAADIVLTNDNLGVIIKAIEEGRVVLDNIRKVITYLLSTGFTEVVLVGGAIIMGLPLPVLPIQILWANLVQEGFMNFALAFEPGEKDVMKRNPLKEGIKNLINREMKFLIFGIGIITDVILFGVFFYLLNIGYEFERIRTLVFVGLSINAIFFVFALKSLRRPLWKINIFSNWYLLGSLALSLSLLIGAVTLNPLRELLKLTPVSTQEFLLILALGIIDLALIEAAKFYFISRSENDS